MSDDSFLEVICDQWDNIVLVYDTFRDRDQIIEFDVTEGKIYSHPASDYIQTLSERTRDQTARQFADATKRNYFLLFIKDGKNQRRWRNTQHAETCRSPSPACERAVDRGIRFDEG